MRNNFTKKILVSTGIRQRGSPILFNIIMSKIIKEMKSADRKYRMKNKKI
jgi:hypothetical protein